MKTIDNFRPQRKKILLRVDLNVPLVDGVIIDKSRIRSEPLTSIDNLNYTTPSSIPIISICPYPV